MDLPAAGAWDGGLLQRPHGGVRASRKSGTDARRCCGGLTEGIGRRISRPPAPCTWARGDLPSSASTRADKGQGSSTERRASWNRRTHPPSSEPTMVPEATVGTDASEQADFILFSDIMISDFEWFFHYLCSACPG